MRTSAVLSLGTYHVGFEIVPAEPEVGLYGESVEITDLADADGRPVEIDDVAAREGVSYDAAEAALREACEDMRDAARDFADVPVYTTELDAGFDPYAGQYTDDC